MPSKRTQAWRQHLVDTVRLLGYIIERKENNSRFVYAIHKGDGLWAGIGVWRTMPTLYQHPWRAAFEALELEGIDARSLAPPGENGISQRRVPKVRRRRHVLERPADPSVPPWARPR